MMSIERAETGDILGRLAECIGSWPSFKKPGEIVEVRADLVTLAYLEIATLRQEKGNSKDGR
jgi:hypothetical protein